MVPSWLHLLAIAAPALGFACGFATSYPVNWWLLRAGIKEAM